MVLMRKCYRHAVGIALTWALATFIIFILVDHRIGAILKDAGQVQDSTEQKTVDLDTLRNIFNAIKHGIGSINNTHESGVETIYRLAQQIEVIINNSKDSIPLEIKRDASKLVKYIADIGNKLNTNKISSTHVKPGKARHRGPPAVADRSPQDGHRRQDSHNHGDDKLSGDKDKKHVVGLQENLKNDDSPKHIETVRVDTQNERYAGDEMRFESWMAVPQLPKAVYDVQPRAAPGEGGPGVRINMKTLTPEERQRFDEGKKKHAFNEYASDLISVRRALPESRMPSCPRQFRRDLPKTSVIICFHNEAWSVLLRSVHSVLDRSPPELIEEVILLDDFSNMEHLGRPLQYYMSRLEKVRIIRTRQREGLIRARLVAVEAARGQVLTFLDSHIECFPGWLEPLLDRVASNESIVVAPVIVMINENTFGTGAGGGASAVGAFDLKRLSFKWDPVPKREKERRQSDADPIRTPAIAGGLFSISKDYFNHIGRYDEGMDIWGFENIEISLRVWMCGGSLEIHPCSAVGHVFRRVSPYDWGTRVYDILRKNAVRLASVWLDDYKTFYFEEIGYNLGDYGDITERKQLRKRLQCKSFQWYIDHVFPEIEIPPKTLYSGEIKCRSQPYKCLDSMAPSPNGNGVMLERCHGMGGNQRWAYTEKDDIQTGKGCLIYSARTQTVVFAGCRDSQKWKVSDGHITHMQTRQCLTMLPNFRLTLQECGESQDQAWDIVTSKRY